MSLIEINYPPYLIKRITPYLNNITNDKGQRISIKQRAFAWYYVYNNNNKADAYRRAYISRYNKETGQLDYLEKELHDSLDGKTQEKRSTLLAVKARNIYRFSYVREMISQIQDHFEKELRSDLQTSMLDQMIIQATYDPSMFFTPTGQIAFNTWEEIPKKYRCCVESIETKAYGKDADTIIRTIKLADRDKARKYLLKICPGLLEAEKMEVLHKTVDTNGKEIGVDFTGLSDKKLIEKYNELKGK